MSPDARELSSLSGSQQAALVNFSALLNTPSLLIELDRALTGDWKPLTSEGTSFEPIRLHESRCSFEIGVVTALGRRSLIGKVYATDRSDLFEWLQAIALSGFGPRDRFAIPAPIAYLGPANVLLQEKVGGSPTMQILAEGTPEQRQGAIVRCATWLSRFHARAPRDGPVLGHDAVLAKARLYAKEIPTSESTVWFRSEELLQAIERAQSHLIAPDLRAGHGSFHPIHVLMCGNRTVTIDLDEYGVRDPAWDLAWFVVGMQRLALRQRGSLVAYDREIETFLEVYEDAHPGGACNLPFYRAVECLHRARTDILKRDPPDRERARLMLEEGFRGL